MLQVLGGLGSGSAGNLLVAHGLWVQVFSPTDVARKREIAMYRFPAGSLLPLKEMGTRDAHADASGATCAMRFLGHVLATDYAPSA